MSYKIYKRASYSFQNIESSANIQKRYQHKEKVYKLRTNWTDVKVNGVTCTDSFIQAMALYKLTETNMICLLTSFNSLILHGDFTYKHYTISIFIWDKHHDKKHNNQISMYQRVMNFSTFLITNTPDNQEISTQYTFQTIFSI